MESTATTALADLVRRAQKGDEAAQRELIVSYQHRVAGFVYAMTGRSDYVEDLAQQVFIKMIRALDRLQAPAQFESWLFRLARHTCIAQPPRPKTRRVFPARPKPVPRRAPREKPRAIFPPFWGGARERARARRRRRHGGTRCPAS